MSITSWLYGRPQPNHEGIIQTTRPLKKSRVSYSAKKDRTLYTNKSPAPVIKLKTLSMQEYAEICKRSEERCK